MPTPQHNCQTCGAEDLHEVAGFQHLPRVTSDSKPYPQGGRLFVCESCSLVQKIVDTQWLGEIDEIYRNYDMYHQSESNDQAVFDPVSGQPRGRCEVLARRLLESCKLPSSGTLLDVGAGSGAMLAAFSSACSGWTLFGLDLDNRKEQALKKIPRFERLFTEPPEKLTQQFDLLSLIHSLEHFTDPTLMLGTLKGRLAPGGQLFVQVNNVDMTPFDLVVADHLCHFTPLSLSYMVARAGYGIEATRVDWIHKEISMLARADAKSLQADHDDAGQAIDKIEANVAWLNGMLDHAREATSEGEFGIFGTSVAATWLASGLGEEAKFFVDEDPARDSHLHLGRPIFRPEQVPPGAVVYLAFVPDIAAAISRRLAHLPIKFAALPAQTA